MAIRDQYEFFKSLYDEEAQRYEDLGERTKLYLGVATTFIGVLAFRADDLKRMVDLLGVPWLLFLVAGVLFSAGIVGCLWSARIRRFEGVTEAAWVIDQLITDPPTDEAFFERRIADYAVAADRNTLINNRTAYALEITLFIIGTGVLVIGACFTVAITSAHSVK